MKRDYLPNSLYINIILLYAYEATLSCGYKNSWKYKNNVTWGTEEYIWTFKVTYKIKYWSLQVYLIIYIFIFRKNL